MTVISSEETVTGLEWIECPVCETLEHTRTLAALADGEAIAECTRCGLQFLNPHLDAQGLDDHYQPKEISVDVVWGEPFAAQRFNAEGYERSGTSKDLRRRIELVQRFVPGGRLLDVGCSIGLMLYEAERRGFEAVGFDISRKMIDYARNVFRVDARLGGFEELSSELGTFAAAVIWDVLEHLPYPGQTMSLIASHLKPGGYVFGHIPNSDGLANRLKTWANLKGLRRKKWSHFGAPMHIMWFNPRNLGLLLAHCGLERVEVGAWSHLRKRAQPGLLDRALNYPLERAVRTSYFWFVARKVAEPPPHRLETPRRWSRDPRR
jgi:SAM-dependent methyltransferase